MNNYSRVLFSLIVVLILTGCEQNSGFTQKIELTSTGNSIGNNTVTFTSIPHLLITETPSPTTAQYMTSTLEMQSIQKTLQPLLQDPFNCVVPCFVGIIPGKTSLQEVKNFFAPFNFRHKDGEDYYSVVYDDSIGQDSVVIINAAENVVQTITIMPDISQQIEGRPREWVSYSPETLIKKFGPPTHVQFAIDWGPNFVIVMIMYFDDIDLIAEYSGYNMFPDRPRSPELCPLTAPFDHIRFWMGSNPPNPPTFETVSLEKATSLTVDQFSQLLLGEPQKACFVLSGDAFGPW